MNAAHSVTAGFDLNTYTLTTATSGTGTGTVGLSPPGGTYTYGTVVTVTANPGTGSQFTSWSGDLSGTTNPTTITMNSNKAVTAIFTSTSNKMHVASITMTVEHYHPWWDILNWFKYTMAHATVTIVDEGGNPVTGATITADWSETYTSHVPGTPGQITFETAWTEDPVWLDIPNPYTFTITNIEKTGWTYDPIANVVTSQRIIG
jgi:hypothetical protein